MTEQTLDNQNNEYSTQETVNNENTQAQQESTETKERMFTQAEVNDLVQKRLAKKSNQTRSELQSQQYGNQHSDYNESNNASREKALTPEEVREMIQQESQYMQNQSLVNSFAGKLTSGYSKYDDFEPTLKDLELDQVIGQNPELLNVFNSLDNPADVLYELGKNPDKFIKVMDYFKQPYAIAKRKGMEELKKLGQSINDNEQAKSKNKDYPKQPLNQINPTRNGSDVGNMTVKDWRKHPSCRE